MLKLSSKQRKYLRSKAHSLKPVVIVGAAGITKNIHTEIDNALNFHELIKIRINSADKDSRNLLISSICLQSKAAQVQSIGHILVLFRKVKDPKIILPKE